MYSVLLELMASAGYTVIATPYAVTFKHLDCAEMVHQRFLQAVNVSCQGLLGLVST